MTTSRFLIEINVFFRSNKYCFKHAFDNSSSSYMKFMKQAFQCKIINFTINVRRTMLVQFPKLRCLALCGIAESLIMTSGL